MSIPGMTNTYIGARYVPIVDGQWDNTKNYEPLIMVTNQGSTYLSKTYVPAGTPLTNNDFWILTANYNAQFAQLQNTVEEYQNTVNQLMLQYQQMNTVFCKGRPSEGILAVEVNIPAYTTPTRISVQGALTELPIWTEFVGSITAHVNVQGFHVEEMHIVTGTQANNQITLLPFRDCEKNVFSYNGSPFVYIHRESANERFVIECAGVCINTQNTTTNLNYLFSGLFI